MSAWSDFWDALEKTSECKFCNFDGEGFPAKPIYDEYTEKNELIISLQKSEDKVVMKAEIWPNLTRGEEEAIFPVNYCPICGRQFTAKEEDDDELD